MITHQLKHRKNPTILKLAGLGKLDILSSVASILNERPRSMNANHHAELVRHVEAWLESGPDWSNRAVWVQKYGISVDGLAFDMERALSLQVLLAPNAAGRAHLLEFDSRGNPPREPAEGLKWFCRLVFDENASAYWGGRCARCKRFYVKNSLKQKVYCSRTCGSKESSRNSKREKDAAAKQEKLDQIRKVAVKGCCTSKKQLAQAAGCSLTFLTRNEVELGIKLQEMDQH